ncbi:hypothetical protein, partial [Lacticaseibacillus paracasei]|uniref:hypothetical protein n=2 Tax=Lacticaseibacillus paracasei TaxID=1597 RepID=UPI0031F69DC9
KYVLSFIEMVAFSIVIMLKYIDQITHHKRMLLLMQARLGLSFHRKRFSSVCLLFCATKQALHNNWHASFAKLAVSGGPQASHERLMKGVSDVSHQKSAQCQCRPR